MAPIRSALVLVASLSFVPPAGAAPLVGSENNPELADAENDVYYHQLSVGPRDHAYLDLRKAWFTYLNESDQIALVFHVVDAGKLASAPAGWDIQCYVNGEITANSNVMGKLYWMWRRPPEGGALKSVVQFEQPSGSVSGSTPPRRLDHAFTATFEAPGAFNFTVSRQALLQYGETVRNPRALCLEELRPAETPGVIYNSDAAAAKAEYSFVDHRPVTTNPEEDPSMTGTPETVQTDPPEDTAGVTLVALVGVLVVAAFVRRSRQ